MVFSLSYHFLHDRDLAEEIAQEVFLALHRHMADIKSPSHAVFWLRKVVVQRSIDETRREKEAAAGGVGVGGRTGGAFAGARPDVERSASPADRHASRDAAYGNDHAVSGRYGPGGDRGSCSKCRSAR